MTRIHGDGLAPRWVRCSAGERLVALAAAAFFAVMAVEPADALSCAGDCRGDGTVTINELVLGVSIVLDTAPVSACPSLDQNHDGSVLVNELIAAIAYALDICPPEPTTTVTPPITISPPPTDSPTPDATSTHTAVLTRTTSATRTGSDTPTPTRTATQTVSGTSTRTITRTATATSTATVTPTPSATSTRSATPTPTQTDTPTIQIFRLGVAGNGGIVGGVTSITLNLTDDELIGTMTIDFGFYMGFSLKSGFTVSDCGFSPQNEGVLQATPMLGNSVLVEPEPPSPTATVTAGDFITCTFNVGPNVAPGSYDVRVSITLMAPDSTIKMGSADTSIQIQNLAGGRCTDMDDSQCQSGACRGDYCCNSADCPTTSVCSKDSGACATPTGTATESPTPFPTTTPFPNPGPGHGEFQVNTTTADTQALPKVGTSANGDFVVAWVSVGQEGYPQSQGVFAQRFASNGNKLGNQFQVNSVGYGEQSDPAVAVNAAGNFAVVWTDESFLGAAIRGRRYSSSGTPLGTEFQVNQVPDFVFSEVSAAAESTGGFVAVWSRFISPTGFDVFGQRFGSTGNKLGSEFLVNSYVGGSEFHPSVAASTVGGFVATWTRDPGDKVFGQRYASNGSKVGTEFQVSSSEGFNSSVAANATGGFVVVWSGTGANGVFGQRLASTGSKLGTEFRVNTSPGDFQTYPAVATDSQGGFVVVWSNLLSSSPDLFVDDLGQRFASDGTKLGSEFRLNSMTGGIRGQTAVAPNALDGFVVVWDSAGQDGSSTGVFGRRIFGGSGTCCMCTGCAGPSFCVEDLGDVSQCGPSCSGCDFVNYDPAGSCLPPACEVGP